MVSVAALAIVPKGDQTAAVAVAAADEVALIQSLRVEPVAVAVAVEVCVCDNLRANNCVLSCL